MLKKIGKKQLLGILTAAAIVVTAVGSFAVWDKLNDTATTQAVQLSPITVTATQNAELTVSERTEQNYTNGDYVPVYTSGNLEFALTGIDGATQQLKLTPTVKVDGTIDNDNFEVVVKEEGTEVASNIDTDLTATTYTVEVKPNATGQAASAALSGKSLTVELKGEIQKKTP